MASSPRKIPGRLCVRPLLMLATVVTAAIAHAQTPSPGVLWSMGAATLDSLGVSLNPTSPVAIAGNARKVSGGILFSFILDQEGTLWANGRNEVGQLGDGSFTDRPLPVRVGANVTDVVALNYEGLILRSDRTLWGTGGRTVSPVLIATDVVSIHKGLRPAFVKADGTLHRAMIGSAVLSELLATGVRAGSSGGSFTHFIKTDGSLWGVGVNNLGQLGDGTRTDRSAPVAIAEDVAEVVARSTHSIYRKNDGSVWSTADGALTQLATGVRQIAVEEDYLLLVKTDDTLWAQGGNSLGRLGAGFSFASTLRQIASGVRSAGTGPTHSLQVLNDGTVLALGWWTVGEMIGNFQSARSTPIAIATDATDVAAKGSHCLFVRSDSSLWTFGANLDGQLGDGTTETRLAPVRIATGVRSVAAGGYTGSGINFFSSFLKSDGSLWSMGYNRFGQLGDGSETSRLSPVQVATGVETVSAGGSHLVFTKSDHSLWTAGSRISGELADGQIGTFRATPARVLEGDARMAAAGESHTLVIKTDSTLWGAGSNRSGQLGLGATTAAVENLRQIGAIASKVVAGGGHTLYLRTDGSVWGTGRNDYGQLGEGTTDRVAQTPIASGVANVFAGSDATCYVKNDGTTWVMGRNTWRQLADAPASAISTPRAFFRGVRTIAFGTYNTYFIQDASAASLPTIATPPASGTHVAGLPITLSVTASGGDPIDFRWRKNGVDIPGARSAGYVIPYARGTDAGRYDVVVTTAAGSVTVAADITVSPAAFTRQPEPEVSVAPGGELILRVEATGAFGVTYQWQKNGVAIPGATGATLTLRGVTSADAGTYTAVVTTVFGSVTSNASVVSLAGSRLANLSVRTNAGAGDQVLIVGLAVGGASTGGEVPLFIRAVGPSLAVFGLSGFLPDPNVSFYSGSTSVAANDDWAGAPALSSAATAVGAFALASPSSKDAALLIAQPAGSYTAQVRGAPDTAGNVLVEIYDAAGTGAPASTPRLVNVSARARTGGADGALIAGFVIRGSTPKNVLIRATGPALAVFGLPGTLADPKLEVFRGGTAAPIATNDNWGGGATLSAAFTQVGAFALNATSRDAALMVSLEPGAYTAQVTGADNGSGVALIEIYDLDR